MIWDDRGWYRPGAVPPGCLGGGTWWVRAGRVVGAALGVHLDAVHTHLGILAAGPFLARMDDGSLARLLTALPADLVARHLGGVSRRSGLGVREGRWMVGLDLATDTDLRASVLGPGMGSSWSEDGRRTAFEWVEGVGCLLADPASYRAHGGWATERLRGLMVEPLRAALGWHGAEPPADETCRRGSAVAVALAAVSPRGAVQLARAVGAHPDALLESACRGAWGEVFGPRAARVRGALLAETWG